MKFLLIAYYFGNSTDVGAQRWNKNIKYIQQFGWEPVVFTFNEQKDIEGQFEIISNKQIEPNTIYKSIFKKKVPSDILTNKKTSLVNKLLIFIRSNFFIPDSRVLSIFSSKRILRKRLKSNDIDIIISTGPPHSMHLIGKSMSKEFNIPWIADFRDPWSGIEYFEKLPLLPIAKLIHKKLEFKILNTCDSVITVSHSWAKHLANMGARKIEVIHNGFDQQDFDCDTPLPIIMSFAHFGTYPKSRNHSNFWSTLNELYTDTDTDTAFKKSFKFDFYGFTYDGFDEQLQLYEFYERLTIQAPIPHSKATKKMSEYRFLFLSLSDTPLSKGRIPLKFYEYLATGRKIIACGEKGSDLSKLIENLNCGYYINYGEEYKLKEILKLESKPDNKVTLNTKTNAKIFSKEHQAKQYIKLFNEIVE